MTSILARLGRDPRGSVALMFALAAMVLIGAVGAAMDYSRAASIQSSLQRAVDGAALLAAKNNEQMSATPMTDASATDYLRKTFASDKVGDLSAKVTFFADSVRVQASVAVPTTLMGVLGITSMPVAVSSEALFNRRVEVILVLDNTGSMAQLNKLPTLQAAAKNFVSKMQGQSGGDDAVRIGIVPFETNVNLGGYKTSWWVDPAQTSYWTANAQTSGCVWDRDQPNDARDTPPSSGVPSTLYGADQTRTSACSISPILPLTTDYAALQGTIDAMVASGTTNLTIGLTWGYHLLSPGEPITNARPFGTKNLSKYVVLMTDGYNTKMRGTTDVAVMDARTRQACDAIKTDGKITLITARIIDGNDGLLRDCATSPDLFFPVSNVAQLDPVFDEIYRKIVGARITR